MSDSDLQPSARVVLLITAVFLSVVGAGVVYIVTEYSPHRPWPFVAMIVLAITFSWFLFTTPKNKQLVRVKKHSKWQKGVLIFLGSCLLLLGITLLGLSAPRLSRTWQLNLAKSFFDAFKGILLPLWMILLGADFVHRGLKREPQEEPEK